jgi:ABC-type molybdate transport system substrate-binding protein
MKIDIHYTVQLPEGTSQEDADSYVEDLKEDMAGMLTEDYNFQPEDIFGDVKLENDKPS